MRIELAGWTSSGVRCPDVTVDLRKASGEVHKVALIQMPNGTGKTTTLQLLNATLSGAAAKWSPEKVRSYRRRNDPAKSGCFKATLLIDGKPLSIELTLDYGSGQAGYRTTSPGSGGVVPRWHVPPTIHRFLAPEFLSLFIFDGELANRLLDSEKAEADHAIDALCQIYLLDQVNEFTRDYWERSTRAQTAKTSTGLSKWQEIMSSLTTREKMVKKAQADAKAQLKVICSEIDDLDQKINERISSVNTVRERHNAAKLELVGAEAQVRSSTDAMMHAMRLPHALQPTFSAQLEELRNNLDLLRLPENTSAQFFEELVREEECICGRPMDQHSIEEIRARAKQFLDADDAGIINALKRDIEQFAAGQDEGDVGFVRVQRLANELTIAVRREKEAYGQVRALHQQLIQSGDEQLAIWQTRLEQCGRNRANFEELLKEIEGAGDAETPTEKLMSLSQIEKQISIAKARISEITETVRLREETELIQTILSKASKRARQRIKDELRVECNTRLQTILSNDPLTIEKIDRSIRLADQDGASVGQTLSVGYTFLMSVLSRGNNDFPLIVDSPANAIDQGVRRRIGRLIPELCSQFVAFTINTERPGFVEALEGAVKDVAFLTLFRKTQGTARLMTNLPKGRYREDGNAVLVTDREYFYAFDIRDEEEQESVIQATH